MHHELLHELPHFCQGALGTVRSLEKIQHVCKQLVYVRVLVLQVGVQGCPLQAGVLALVGRQQHILQGLQDAVHQVDNGVVQADVALCAGVLVKGHLHPLVDLP